MICEHKKNSSMRIFNPLPLARLLNDDEISQPDILTYKDIKYIDLDEERKKELEARECWICK